MKKRNAALVLIIALFVVSGSVWGWDIPGLPTKAATSSSGAQAVDIDALGAKEAAIYSSINKSMEYLNKGVQLIALAHGYKDQAEALERLAAQACADRSSCDGERLKAYSDQTEGNMAIIAKATANKEPLSKEGKKQLLDGSLLVGASGLASYELVKKVEDYKSGLDQAIKSVQASPLTYGLKAGSLVKRMTGSVTLMSNLVQFLPKQGGNLGKSFAGLVTYCKSNGISLDDKQVNAEMTKTAHDIVAG